MVNKRTIIITSVIIIFLLLIGMVIFIPIFSTRESIVQGNPLCEEWIPDDRYDIVSFCSQEEALEKASEIGCEGFHDHDQEGVTLYMSCEKHTDLDPFVLGSTGTEQSGGTY